MTRPSYRLLTGLFQYSYYCLNSTQFALLSTLNSLPPSEDQPSYSMPCTQTPIYPQSQLSYIDTLQRNLQFPRLQVMTMDTMHPNAHLSTVAVELHRYITEKPAVPTSTSYDDGQAKAKAAQAFHWKVVTRDFREASTQWVNSVKGFAMNCKSYHIR